MRNPISLGSLHARLHYNHPLIDLYEKDLSALLRRASVGQNLDPIKAIDLLYDKLQYLSDPDQIKIYADAIVQIREQSGYYLDQVLDEIASGKVGVALCAWRDQDRCSMYCDGFDTSCEEYAACHFGEKKYESKKL